MKRVILLFVLGINLLVMGGEAEASKQVLPSGLFSGFASNNPFNEWCVLRTVTVEFIETSSNSYQLRWEESGNNQGNFGFCESIYDANLVPTAQNEWNVDFAWNRDLVFGRAKLKDGVLTINASFSGFYGNPFQTFEARFALDQKNLAIDYTRQISRWSGPSLFATGRLYR